MRKFITTETLETHDKLKSRFWIIREREAEKWLLGRCFVCRRLKDPVFKSQEPSLSLHFRVDRERSFETIGIDYCGPV